MIEGVRIVKNKKNEYNLQFLKGNEWNLLYDHNKIRESVKDEIKKIGTSNFNYIILVGVGLGYHLIELINANKGKEKNIIAIEPIKIISSAANKLFDLKNAVSSSAYYVYGNKTEIENKINEISKILHINIKNIKFIIPQAYIKFFKDEVKEIIDTISAKTQASAITLGNSIEDTILGIYNMFRNTESITESIPLGSLKDNYKNLPLVIVSAGPSLDKNINFLKKYQDRVIVVSTDATFKMLLNLGIRVDFVSVLERDYVTYEKFFKNVSYNETPTLLYQSVAWPTVASSFKNSKIITFKNLSTETKFAEYLGNDYKYLESGTSVATMSLSFARFVGANPIILIGQDLAYSEDGYTHASNVVVRKKQNFKNSIELDGINGKKVKSTAIWRNFKFELEDIINKNNLNVIDATEGGALIRGTKIMRLEKVLKDLPKISIDYEFKNTKLDSKKIFTNIETYKNFLTEEIQKSIKILKQCKNIGSENWEKLWLTFKKASEFVYFRHFHSSNMRMLMYYHYSNQDNKINHLFDSMIESSNLLIEYIIKGFKIGRDYKKLYNTHDDELVDSFEENMKKIDFFIKYDFPDKILKLLKSMEKRYIDVKERCIIYKLFMRLYSEFNIEKFDKLDKIIAYGLKFVNSKCSQYQKSEDVYLMISNALEINLDKLILFKRNFSKKSYNESLNNILKVLLVINNRKRQCEIIKYFDEDFNSFERSVAHYNCLVYNNRMKDAKDYLKKLSEKFPNNSIIKNELEKYNNIP